jgi:hypothetical protein
MPKTTKPKQVVRIPCSVDGYEACWVEIDVSEWAYAEYMDIWATPYPLVTLRYFEPYCSGWHIECPDGVTVPFPNPDGGVGRERWQAAYKALGVANGRKLGNWFPTACLLAAAEAMTLDKKSASPGPGDGPGPGDAGGRDAGDAADGAATGVDG